jgi:hypothetical protein
MAFDLAGDLAPMPDGVEVRKVTSNAHLSIYLAVAEEVFGDHRVMSDPERTALLSSSEMTLLLALIDTLPVGVGTLDSQLAAPVGLLRDGCVRSAWRGRGAYRALVTDRLVRAKNRGQRLVFTDAREGTSAPILARLGFSSVARETTWILAPA